jgi:hypothetical protein
LRMNSSSDMGEYFMNAYFMRLRINERNVQCNAKSTPFF